MPKIGVLYLLFGLVFGLTECKSKNKEEPETETGSNQIEVLAKPNWTAVENSEINQRSISGRVDRKGKIESGRRDGVSGLIFSNGTAMDGSG